MEIRVYDFVKKRTIAWSCLVLGDKKLYLNIKNKSKAEFQNASASIKEKSKIQNLLLFHIDQKIL